MLVVIKKISLLSLLATLCLQQAACGGSFGLLEIENSERNFQQRQKDILLDRMSLNTIFTTDMSRRLARAAGRGDVKEIEKLIGKNADLNFKGKGNGTALYWSFRKKNLIGFEYLLKRGADPNIEFSDGGTIVHRAASGEFNDYLRLALQYGGAEKIKEPARVSPLDATISLFCEGSCRVAAALLLDAGADVDGVKKGGIPILNSAVRNGNFDIAFDLLTRGADPYKPGPFDRRTTVDDIDDGMYPSVDDLSSYQSTWLKKFKALLDSKREN